MDNNEVNNIVNEHSTNVTTIDIIGMSRIKVLQNKDNLYFVIKYPIPNKVCKKLSLFSVPHHGRVLHFGDTNTVAECGNIIFAVKCEKSTFATFCKTLKTETCAQQLVLGVTANCSTTVNHNKGVTEIDDGIILISNDTAKVKGESGTTRVIKGTYLLTFEQHVTVNGVEFRNRNIALKRAPGTPTDQKINHEGHLKTLSLNYLHELNTENINYIGELRDEINMKTVIFISTIAVVTILLVAKFILVKYKKFTNRKTMKDMMREVTERIADDPHLGREELTRNPKQQIVSSTLSA